MTEPMSGRDNRDQDVPDAVAVPKRRFSLPLVWLVPIVAALVGCWLAVEAYQERGPTITISFETAQGVSAGKTTIKYKDVDIGKVTDVALTADHSRIIATATLVHGADKFLADDTRFWVVRPRFAGGQAYALGTLLSGSYIGMDIGKSTKSRRHFVGLEAPPLVTEDRPGRQFVLHGKDLGSLAVGLPVLFHHFKVGEVTAYELDKGGLGVTAKIFVDAPYDRFVVANTRFWNAGGVDFKLDANGVELRTASLVSILIGGIAFDLPAYAQNASRAPANAMFTLFGNRAQAMQRPPGESKNYVLYFKDSLHGLSVGAPVEFGGVELGRVTAINVEYDKTHGFRFPVHIVIYPDRLHRRYQAGSKYALNIAGSEAKLFDALVQQGLRAQLRTGSLVTGKLYVAFDFFPGASKATIDWSKHPVALATTTGGLTALQTSIGRIAGKLEKLPLAEIAGDSQRTLQTLDKTLKSLNKLTKGVDSKLQPEASSLLRSLSADAPAQLELRKALYEVGRAAKSVSVLADYLTVHPQALLLGRGSDEHSGSEAHGGSSDTEHRSR